MRFPCKRNPAANSCTNVILRRLGGPNKVQRLLRETNMYRELRLVEYIPPDGRTYRNKLSMGDLSSLFQRLWIGRVLGPGFSDLENEQASSQMLHLLSLSGRSDKKDRLVQYATRALGQSTSLKASL